MDNSNRYLKRGESCGHPGCLHHVSHPCEKCGRIAGEPLPLGQYYALQSDGHNMLCNADGTRSIFDDVDE